MQKAVSWMMTCSLRQLFVHYQKISYHNSIRAQNLAYSSICQMLINEGHSIADFPVMPQVVVNDYDESCDKININFANIDNEL